MKKEETLSLKYHLVQKMPRITKWLLSCFQRKVGKQLKIRWICNLCYWVTINSILWFYYSQLPEKMCYINSLQVWDTKNTGLQRKYLSFCSIDSQSKLISRDRILSKMWTKYLACISLGPWECFFFLNNRCLWFRRLWRTCAECDQTVLTILFPVCCFEMRVTSVLLWVGGRVSGYPEGIC